jgi:SNF2 family DNA or RNA helicase
VLLLQLQSGGVGLNLQHFTKIIFMSPWWTSALMDQAIGRAVRIGQKERVTVTMLVLKEEETMNIDAKMLEKAETKRGMLDMLFRYANKGEISHDTAEEPQNGDDEDPK